MLFVPTLFPRVPHLPTIQGSGPYVCGIGGRVVERYRRGICVAPDDSEGQRHAEGRGRTTSARAAWSGSRKISSCTSDHEPFVARFEPQACCCARRLLGASPRTTGSRRDDRNRECLQSTLSYLQVAPRATR